MTFDQQKREAIATANVIIGLLMQVCDESPETTADERKWMLDAFKRIKAARLLVLSILDSQDNPE
jgi:hypothetical protein